MIIKPRSAHRKTRRFIICQSKGQADILKAAELSIFKITMEGKAKKYEDRKDLTDYMEPVGEKEVHMDQTDGSFSWADVCVCGGHAGIGYYAVLGAAGELAARKIQAEGISVRILFPEETEEEFLADVCGESKKAASALSKADVFVGRGNGGGANSDRVRMCRRNESTRSGDACIRRDCR